MQLPSESSEERSEMLDPHRREEREGVATEIAGRLLQKGVDVEASEEPALLADLLSAVERFETAVINKGGDLMVNMPTSSEPQNLAFVVPERQNGEPLEAYMGRINAAAEVLEEPRHISSGDAGGSDVSSSG